MSPFLHECFFEVIIRRTSGKDQAAFEILRYVTVIAECTERGFWVNKALMLSDHKHNPNAYYNIFMMHAETVSDSSILPPVWKVLLTSITVIMEVHSATTARSGFTLLIWSKTQAFYSNLNLDTE